MRQLGQEILYLNICFCSIFEFPRHISISNLLLIELLCVCLMLIENRPKEVLLFLLKHPSIHLTIYGFWLFNCNSIHRLIVYCSIEHKGIWRTTLMKTSRNGEIVIIIFAIKWMTFIDGNLVQPMHCTSGTELAHIVSTTNSCLPSLPSQSYLKTYF